MAPGREESIFWQRPQSKAPRPSSLRLSPSLPSSTHLLSGLQSLLGYEGKLPRDFLVQLLQLLFPSHCEKRGNYQSVLLLLPSAKILVNGTQMFFKFGGCRKTSCSKWTRKCGYLNMLVTTCMYRIGQKIYSLVSWFRLLAVGDSLCNLGIKILPNRACIKQWAIKGSDGADCRENLPLVIQIMYSETTLLFRAIALLHRAGCWAGPWWLLGSGIPNMYLLLMGLFLLHDIPCTSGSTSHETQGQDPIPRVIN